MDRKKDAMRRGLMMAAKVAAVAGLLAATASQARAADQIESTAASDAAKTSAAELAYKVKIGGAKGCGCAPCWGPPAPPAMGWLEDVQPERAA